MKRIDAFWTSVSVMLIGTLLLVVTLLTDISMKKHGSEIQRGKYLAQSELVADRIDDIDFLKSNDSEFRLLLSEPDNSSQRRVVWAEWFENARSELGVGSLSFEIYPFRKISGDSVIFGYEEIELELGLIHDTQLVRVLAYLDNQSTQKFVTTSLEVRRAKESPSIVEGESKPNLEVNCTFRWYTFNAEATKDVVI